MKLRGVLEDGCRKENTRWTRTAPETDTGYSPEVSEEGQKGGADSLVRRFFRENRVWCPGNDMLGTKIRTFDFFRN